MTTTNPTPTQHAILAYTLEHTDGKIAWFPDHIKGGARKKVLDGLLNRTLITADGTDWGVAAEGYNAMGRARPTPDPAPVAPTADPEIEATVTAAEATWAKEGANTKPRTRENSKQAQVIAMLNPTEPEMTNTRPIPATQNDVWGFWGTMDDQATAAWPLAMTAVSDAKGQPLESVRTFLDSRHGRHFATPPHARAGVPQP